MMKIIVKYFVNIFFLIVVFMSTKIDINTVSILFYKVKNNVPVVEQTNEKALKNNGYSITYVYIDFQYIVSNIKSLKRLLIIVFIQL